jgi:tetratricopeptide (TPR) repeat protein
VAINKNKINDNALKFIQKGQIKKAIKEYEKILADDAGDVRTLLKKGDLLVRVGERDQAVDTYLAVAGAYSQQGFHLKAVAVFKQILKIDDGRIDVNLRLAEEYQNLGIIGDAMSHLQLVAAYYDQQGLVRESLDILRRIVDLDPDNIASRIKLAELYSREEMMSEAVEEFRRAAEELKNANRIEDYIKVTERLIFHDPTDIQRIKELANIYLQRGDTKRALGKLQICFKSDPRDLDTLSMLAMAFQELGQLSKTVSVHKEMAKIYQDQGSVAEMQDVYRRILEIAPEDPDANQALGAGGGPVAHVEPVEASMPQVTMPTAPQVELDAVDIEPSYDPEPEFEEQMTVEAPRPKRPAVQSAPQAGPASGGVSDQAREFISRLLTETDVYIKYGLHNKAYEHLNKVFEQDPNNIEAHDKLKGLYLTAGQSDHAAHEMVTLVHLSARIGDSERARAYLQELLAYAPGHPDLPGLQGMIEQQVPLGPAEGYRQPSQGEDFAALEPGGPAVMVADEAGLVEIDSDLESVDVSLDFETSGEFSVDTGELIDESADDQFTAPAMTRPGPGPAVISLGDEPSDEVILLDDLSSPGQAGALDTTREADVLDDFDLVPDSLDGDFEPDSPGEIETSDDDDDEAPTRIADLSDVQFASLDDDAQPVDQEMSALLEDYGLGEETIELGQMSTGVYPPGGPLEAAEDLEPEDHDSETVARPVDVGAMMLDDMPDLEPVSADELPDDLEPQLVGGPQGQPAVGDGPAVIALDDGGQEEFDPVQPEELEPGAQLSAALATAAAAQEPDSAIDLVAPDPVSSKGVDDELIEFEGTDDPFFAESQPGFVRGPGDTAEATATTDEADAGEVATKLHLDAPAPIEAEPAEEDDYADEDSDLEDGIEEVEFFIQQNLLDEAADAIEALKEHHADHPDVVALADKLVRLIKGEAPIAQVSPEDLGDSFDLAAEIEREVGDDFSAPIVDEFQYSVDDVFSEFKKGVEKVVEKEDSATHFDLGIAYKEMGLVDDAIAEFTVASQDNAKRAEALAMIGLCMAEKGQYSEAINRYKDALHSPGISEHEATGLYYEMGNVYQLLNDLNEATFYFKKVYKRDPKFRDVTVRLKALVKSVAGKKSSDGEDAKPSNSSAGSKNKISYM